jgi:hypothetical protein
MLIPETQQRFIVESIYPQLTVEHLVDLAPFTNPTRGNQELVTMHCPYCHDVANHFLGTGVINCVSCGILSLIDIIAKSLGRTVGQTVFHLAKEMNLSIPFSVLSKADVKEQSFSSVLLRFIKISTSNQKLLKLGFYEHELLKSYRLTYIDSAFRLINEMVFLFGWIPKQVEEQIIALEDKPMLTIFYNGRLHFSELGKATTFTTPVIPIWPIKMLNTKTVYFISDNLLLLEFMAIHGFPGALVNPAALTPKAKLFLCSLSKNKQITAFWSQEKNKDIELQLQEKSLYYPWLEDINKASFTRIRKLIGE